MTTMSNGSKCSISDGPSYSRYMESALVNGGTTSHDDNNNNNNNWCDSYDVNSLLQDAPVDSIRQRTHVEREESIIDSQTSSEADDDDDVREKVDVEFIDGQVQAVVVVVVVVVVVIVIVTAIQYHHGTAIESCHPVYLMNVA